MYLSRRFSVFVECLWAQHIDLFLIHIEVDSCLILKVHTILGIFTLFHWCACITNIRIVIACNGLINEGNFTTANEILMGLFLSKHVA